MWQEPFIAAIIHACKVRRISMRCGSEASGGVRPMRSATSTSSRSSRRTIKPDSCKLARAGRAPRADRPLVWRHTARCGPQCDRTGGERIDLLFIDHAGAQHRSRDGTRCLIDHGDIYDHLAEYRDWPELDRTRVAFLITDFYAC